MSKRKKRESKWALRLEWIEAGSLESNPANWRRHGEAQVKALGEILNDAEVGWAGALLYNERTGRLIDGHARRDAVSPNTRVPVLVGRWSEEAERKILLCLDPLAVLADCDELALDKLIQEVEFDTPGLLSLVERLSEGLPDGVPVSTGTTSELGPLSGREVLPPPGMTWVLIGIPTVRLAEIAEMVEKIAGKRGVFCEVVANDD